MSGTESREEKQLRLARELAEYLRPRLNTPVSVRLWDGSVVPLGEDEPGLKRAAGENADFIQFHYDVSNDFYRLFLDKQMLYSCAYFHDWNESLEQAQLNKLDMICRKLQLQPGENYLDIGCGWGGSAVSCGKALRSQC